MARLLTVATGPTLDRDFGRPTSSAQLHPKFLTNEMLVTLPHGKQEVPHAAHHTSQEPSKDNVLSHYHIRLAVVGDTRGKKQIP